MTFQTEYDYLIHLIACFLNGTTPEEKPEALDFQKVLQEGFRHQVLQLAYGSVAKLKNKPSEDLMESCMAACFQLVRLDSDQQKARDELVDALHRHRVYTLEVQGTVVKRYYPQSYLRMMSDVDLIIQKEQLSTAEEVLRQLGYDILDSNEIEIDAQRGTVNLELHTDFFYESSTTYPVLEHPFSFATLGEDYTATVTDTEFYLFHLLHTIKHYDYAGLGIRRIVDLYYLEKALKDTVDHELLDKTLRQYGFYEIKCQLLAVKDHWFCGIEPAEDLRELEEEIFDAGLHGTKHLKYTKHLKQQQAQGKRFVILRQIFPEKADLYAAYPVCKKHKLPVFFCWVYRWFMLVFSREKRKEIKESLSSR